MNTGTLEAVTTAKAILKTSKCDIEIDIWAKEIPIGSLEFLKGCIKQDYKDYKFDTLIRNKMLQCHRHGKTDEVNAVAYKNEVHNRIKFNSRGLVGLLRNKANEILQPPEFFITLDKTTELNGKHAIIGRVSNESMLNILGLVESSLLSDEDHKTMVYPITINSCEVPVPYFEQELSEVERQFQIKIQGSNQHEKKEKSNKKKKRLNISLNFDENEDEDENSSLQFEPAAKKKKPELLNIEDDDGNEQDDVLNFNKVPKSAKKFKMKSSHDLLNDKSLKKEVTKKSKFNQNDKTEMILKEDKIKDEDTNSIKDTKIAINIKVEENALKDAHDLHGDKSSPSDLDQKVLIPVTKDKEIRDRNTLDKLKEFQEKLNVAAIHKAIETVARREEENSSEADYGDGLSEEEDDLDFWKEKLVFKDS
ncbi:hypothetical protein B5S33_g2943 [[Candida] boidinii]|nr:hypothetical protein B5S33_g2943 [[Candida] boidinii]